MTINRKLGELKEMAKLLNFSSLDGFCHLSISDKNDNKLLCYGKVADDANFIIARGLVYYQLTIYEDGSEKLNIYPYDIATDDDEIYFPMFNVVSVSNMSIDFIFKFSEYHFREARFSSQLFSMVNAPIPSAVM